jgi:hypothetical protein
LLAHGRWFSPDSSTTKTGRHDIAEILLKVALKHQKSKSNYICCILNFLCSHIGGVIVVQWLVYLSSKTVELTVVLVQNL